MNLAPLLAIACRLRVFPALKALSTRTGVLALAAMMLVGLSGCDFRLKGLRIQELMGSLSRQDARAVEQALIEIHGLSRNGGTLMNSINSIAQTNPAYAAMLRRGLELLESIGYTGS